MTRTLAVSAIAALALTLTSCSDSDPDGDDDAAAAQAISDSIMDEQDGGAATDIFAMKRAEADCIGEGFVDEIGVAKLQEYGFLTDDLQAEPMTNVAMDEPDAEAATGVLFDCADVPGLMAQALASGQQLDAKTRRCLEDVLTDEKLRSMFTLMFTGDQDAAGQEVIEPMLACAAPTQ
jgi:hypothetical protein